MEQAQSTDPETGSGSSPGASPGASPRSARTRKLWDRLDYRMRQIATRKDPEYLARMRVSRAAEQAWHLNTPEARKKNRESVARAKAFGRARQQAILADCVERFGLTPGERDLRKLKQALDYGLHKRTLAQYLGMAPCTVTHWFQGRGVKKKLGAIELGLIVALGMVGPWGAYAAPPPKDSADSYDLSPYTAWIEQQHDAMGWLCCSLADGREVEARTVGSHYEVRFLHPEDIIGQPAPEPGRWYPVPDSAVIQGVNPTGVSIAWWFVMGQEQQGGPIRCFAPGGMY